MSTSEVISIESQTTNRSRRERLSPGIIHFDVTQGCTAELLNGALLDLGLPLDAVVEAFKALGIEHVAPIHRTEATGRVFGSCLDFVHDAGFSISRSEPNHRVPRRREQMLRRRSPRWDRAQPEVEAIEPAQPLSGEQETQAASPNEFEIHRHEVGVVSAWLRAKPGTIDDLVRHVRDAQLPPIPSALAQKALVILADALRQAHGSEDATVMLDGLRLMRILCDVVSFAVLLSKLDPLEVSATRLPLSRMPLVDDAALTLDERGWILALVEDVPTYEYDWPAPYSDALGIALLKSVAAHFGARGESRLLQSGVGVTKALGEPRLLARALWCEPASIATRTVEGPSAVPKVSPSVQIRGFLGLAVDVPELIRRLSGMGARTVSTSQVMELGLHARTSLSLVASYADAEKVIEAILVTGEAAEVSASFVEQHALQRRTVGVPFGRGQKQQQCRVVEWVWGERILRAEPLGSDLSALAAATGYAQEIIRGDVLMAWRKWRGFE